MAFTVCVTTEYDREVIASALAELPPEVRVTYGPEVGRDLTRDEVVTAAADAGAVIASSEAYDGELFAALPGAAHGDPRRRRLQRGGPGGSHRAWGAGDQRPGDAHRHGQLRHGHDHGAGAAHRDCRPRAAQRWLDPAASCSWRRAWTP